MLMLSFAAAALLVAVHLFSGRLRFLSGTPRSRWLSSAGGVSVAYVFIHLLPEIARGQRLFEDRAVQPLGYLEHHAYLLALTGLVVFYGLERLVKRRRERLPKDAETPPGVFWLHIASFSVYNVLVGYLLLHREEPGLSSLIWFAVAMALHFLVNDFGLQQDHRGRFDRIGRWVLSAALLVGWTMGVFIEVTELAISACIAFLTGSVILNVMKEELPEERASRFSAFLLGAFGYAALLLAL